MSILINPEFAIVYNNVAFVAQIHLKSHTYQNVIICEPLSHTREYKL